MTSLLKNWEYKLGIFIIFYYAITHFILESTNVHTSSGLSNHLRVIPQQVLNHLGQSVDASNIKWAYMQYATTYAYLNLALINFIRLRQGGTKIQNLVVLYVLNLNDGGNQWHRLQALADSYDIKLKPISKISAPSESSLWSESFTKFHIFNEIEYSKIVYFDSDLMVVQHHLDELFQLEEFDISLPQAYWLNNVLQKKPKANLYTHKNVDVPTDKQYSLRMQKIVSEIKDHKIFDKLPTLIYEHHKWDNRNDFFANHVMVLTPSTKTFTELMEYVENPWSWSIFSRSNLRQTNEYDMEILNKWLDDKLRSKKLKVGILPHKVYGVLTGEFRETHHRRFTVEPQYLPFIEKELSGSWDAKAIAREVKLVHFSDSPIPKPWEHEDDEYYNSYKLYCSKNFDEVAYKEKYPGFWKPKMTEDCDSVEVWDALRDEYRSLQGDYWVLN